MGWGIVVILIVCKVAYDIRSMHNGFEEQINQNIIGFGVIGVLVCVISLNIDSMTFSRSLEGGEKAVVGLLPTFFTPYFIYWHYKNRFSIDRPVGAILGLMAGFVGFAILAFISWATDNKELTTALSCFMVVCYFLTIGIVNALMGVAMTAFNIFVALYSLFTGTIDPFFWTDLLDLVSVNNIFVQWGIVVLSACLAAYKDGFLNVVIERIR